MEELYAISNCDLSSKPVSRLSHVRGLVRADPGSACSSNLQPALETSHYRSISSIGDAEFSMDVQKNQD